MDHVRTTIAWLKKNYFWVSCGVIVFVGLGVWWVVTSDLSSRTEENKKDIASNFDNLSNVSRIPQHPNPISKEKMETLIGRLKQSVQIGWEKQFDQQGNEIFVWPDFLSEKAIDKLKTLRPIERYVGFPMTPRQEQLIPSEWRYDYNQKIEDELEKLAEKIGAEWNPSQVATGGAFENFGGEGPIGGLEGPRTATAAKDIVVQWNPANQGQIRARFDWTERPERAPTTIEMLYAQEDLWVLKSIMDVVKDTNGNANAAYNAVIRQVDDIQIGRNASTKAGSVMRLASAGVGDDEFGPEEDPYAIEGEGYEGEGLEPEGFLPEGEEGYEGEGLPGGPGGQQAALVDPASYRYVDKNFKPLSATTLRESANKTPGAEATVEQAELAYLAVAKRMPIRVRLRIDQRKLGKFLTACGNAPLTIEVRQVRVFMRQPIPGGAANTGGGEFGGSGGGGPVEMFSGGGGGGGEFGGGEFGGGGGANRTNMAPALDPKYPFDVNVEVYGIVYIYNPVAEEWFKVPDDGSNEEGIDPPLTSINRNEPTG